MREKKMTDVTILINSCDLYEDAWEPGLDLLYIQWSECPYEIVINAETKEYTGKYPNVKTICPKTKSYTWSQRLKDVLEKINTPYVLFTLEDYFILSKVNQNCFGEAVEILNKNENVGMICLSQTERANIKTTDFESDNFYSRIVNKDCKIWCRINLYRREYLLRLLKEHENIWEFEKYASYRAEKLNYIILQQNNNSDEIFTFNIRLEDGYGISLRKWLPSNKQLFEKYNIYVNYDGLGILETMPSEIKLTSRSSKSMVREWLYRVKVWPKKSIKKIKKAIRIYRSKH